MTKQPTRPDEGADDADPLAASAGPENGQVTRPLILQTALTIIDRDGADSLSMRRLSEAVGRDPAVLYRHVPNKAAVLDGVAEIVLEQLTVDTADPDWAGQLRTVAHDFRRLALAHPNVVALLVTRPLATRSANGAWNSQAPRRRPRAAHLRRVHRRRCAAHLPGAVRLPARPRHHRVTRGRRATRGNRPRTAPRPAPAEHHRIPLVRALAPALASYDGAAELDRGLDLLLPSLTAALTRADGSPRTR